MMQFLQTDFSGPRTEDVHVHGGFERLAQLLRRVIKRNMPSVIPKRENARGAKLFKQRWRRVRPPCSRPPPPSFPPRRSFLFLRTAIPLLFITTVATPHNRNVSCRGSRSGLCGLSLRVRGDISYDGWFFLLWIISHSDYLPTTDVSTGFGAVSYRSEWARLGLRGSPVGSPDATGCLGGL